MLPPIKCLTYNVQGISHVHKWRLLWQYVHKMRPHVVCLQEHNQHNLVGQKRFFVGYHIFYAGQRDFSGVVMLVRDELNLQITYNDQNGR